MHWQKQSPAEHIARTMEVIYSNGMTTLSGGNISVMTHDDQLWITPAGVDKGKVTADDMVCLNKEGTVKGKHRPSSELPFHQKIYRQRKDIKAVIHAHPPGLMAFSLAHELPDPEIIPSFGLSIGKIGYAAYALPGSQRLSVRIAEPFAAGCQAVLLENHGVVTAGATLWEAFHRLEALELLAAILIQAKRIGQIKKAACRSLLAEYAEGKETVEIETPASARAAKELKEEMVRFIMRGLNRRLLFSSLSVLSVRVNSTDFLITPADGGLVNITTHDLVLLSKGRSETGKRPHPFDRLHHTIYRQHAAIGTIIQSPAPHITAFAVSDQRFDSRLIPESYVVLRETLRVSLNDLRQNLQDLSSLLSAQRPALLLENEGVLITGANLLQAFDRLEVADFSARAMIDALTAGKINPIPQNEIREIEKKFLT
ncbi:class II aldolase/adducin family protein [Caldithrix abyssi DSM 13497]|uniref:Class II aldolase/adducin family protein n=1 Tax=Caldithrix abyssi DSM 13497 TaxID=880073 RepID=H1XSK1_CALAY|nr:class II aldolase/adducin family protein [Caldithrix abyssi]APF18557.1 L-fuculose-phosphate aldolase [Caldithrix abyssi DSM 13497]EHO42549.1 class II aldolase/adducin family protein [Caldithrix abyssi DSM 13497]